MPQPDGSKLATVQIAFKGLRQSFSTINRHLPPESIVMQLQQGPFKSLHGTWRFTRIRDDACRVELSLEYQFGAGLLGRALAPVFDHIAATMVDAFVDRADQLYGEAGK
jgi:ribosome-associated toxin RatA of RatAB toxin-antitoxin module